MTTYYLPNRLHELPPEFLHSVPEGCKQIMFIFTARRAMQRYYGKGVDYRKIEITKRKKQNGTEAETQTA